MYKLVDCLLHASCHQCTEFAQCGEDAARLRETEREVVDEEEKEDQQFHNMNFANVCGFNKTRNVIWISISYKNNHKSADHINNE